MLRSHTCGELRINHVGLKVSLCGWVQKVRDKGKMIWIDLRDRYGVTQLIFEEESTPNEIYKMARECGREFVLQASGVVSERSAKNKNIETGDIEIVVESMQYLNKSKVPPFIIEDKTGLKKNSLFGNEVPQTQDSIENFSDKISSAKSTQITEDFMIIARIESLILQAGMDDALKRAKAYLAAGADGIMIHSREKDPAEIFEFCHHYSKLDQKKPLVVVPSSFNSVTEDELQKAGVNIVIYANQLLRSAFPAMQSTAETILKHGRSLECDSKMLSIKNILELIPGTK